jgi:hypothetical protein
VLKPRGDTAISAVDTPAGPDFEVANKSAQREIAWIGHQLTIAIRSHELLTERAAAPLEGEVCTAQGGRITLRPA